MAEIPRGPTTKEKLASIVHGFDEFDTEMKRGTRVSLQWKVYARCKQLILTRWYNFHLQQRREKDEFRITELKTEMSRLDSDLTVEIKRRTEMNKSTQIVSSSALSLLSPQY